MRTILLDLDGTIIDSQQGILSSCRAALRALGHEPPELAPKGLIGPPIEDVMRLLLRPFGDDRVQEAAEAYRADYGAGGLLLSTAYAGMPAALAALREGGATLYVATSKRTVFARRILEHLGLAGFFAGIHGSEPGGAMDEKPEIVAHALATHGLAPEGCVMVGDRRYDISGGHANRVRALGVLWGYGTREELEMAGADGIVENPADLAASCQRV